MAGGGGGGGGDLGVIEEVEPGKRGEKGISQEVQEDRHRAKAGGMN